MNMLQYENKYWDKGINYLGGIDEAGRGPLAGPGVASCVILHPNTMIKGVNDSVLIKEYEHEIVTLPFGYGLTIIRVLNNPNNNKKINITWRKE